MNCEHNWQLERGNMVVPGTRYSKAVFFAALYFCTKCLEKRGGEMHDPLSG